MTTKSWKTLNYTFSVRWAKNPNNEEEDASDGAEPTAAESNRQMTLDDYL